MKKWIANEMRFVEIDGEVYVRIEDMMDSLDKIKNCLLDDRAFIKCDCDDPSCPKYGYTGEVSDHIEDCSCAKCHRELGKL